MKLKDVVKALNLDVQAGKNLLEREITGGYAGDLLSDVLANSKHGDVWVTLQTHANIVAVASAKELSGIIIVNGRAPEEETVRRAEEQSIPIMISSLSTYKVISRLSELGIK
jgi:serine kinase of HPr protein (carbohydrate metabolism regulator)